MAINYRVGPLGFIPQDRNGTGGLNGINDIIVGLELVQKIISNFGGDP